MKHLIFDFDGVLGDTSDSRIEVLQEMDGKSKEEILISSDLYFTKSTHTRDLNMSDQALGDLQSWITKFGTLLSKKEFNLFHDFIEEIKKISDANLAVVSSGSNIYVKPRLENCGLEFSHILTFEDHHSKEEKVEMICKDWGVSVKDVYFFTDTISDVVELENLLGKNKIYGCAWGYQGRDRLLSVLEEGNVLTNFSDIGKIFTNQN